MDDGVVVTGLPILTFYDDNIVLSIPIIREECERSLEILS